MPLEGRLAKQMRLVLLMRCLRSAIPAHAVMVMWYQECDVSQRHIMWFTSFASVILFVAEVPSGWVADRFGRRLTLVTSLVIQGASLVATACGKYRWGCFLLGQVLKSISLALFSGTDTALVFESMRNMQSTDADSEIQEETRRQESRQLFCMGMVECVAGLAGVAVGEVLNLEAVLIASAVPPVIGAVVASQLEDTMHTHRRRRGSLGIQSAIKGAWDMLPIFGMGGVVFMATYLFLSIFQMRLKEQGHSIAMAGSSYPLMNATTACTALLAPYLMRMFQEKSLLVLSCLCAVGYFAMGLHSLPMMLVGGLCLGVARGMAWPTTSSYLNEKIGSRDHLRATIISLYSGWSRTFIAVGALAIGVVTEHTSLTASCWVVGAMIFITALLLSLRKVKHD
eukprot:Sspe_Gene.86000::Locus_56737_Transcript_1_1_Confidence_1.000_Length_2320::g.86000::m.86000